MHLGNANLWRFFCARMFCMLSAQWPIFSPSKLVSELHKKSHVTLGCEDDKIKILTLLENSVVTGMQDLSTRLIHRDWPVINIHDGYQMYTKRKKNIWRFVVSLCLSLSLHLSPFSLLSSFFATLPSIHSTILMYNAELIDTTPTRNTQVQNDRQTRVCVCVCVSLFHSEVCRLSYRLWYLADRHVTALFLSRSSRLWTTCQPTASHITTDHQHRTLFATP